MSKKTPSAAETMSATHPRKRARRNRSIIGTRYVVWACRIREKRESLNISLDNVAKAIGIAKNTLWQIEQGGDPQLVTAMKIAEFFGCRVETLWPKKVK